MYEIALYNNYFIHHTMIFQNEFHFIFGIEINASAVPVEDVMRGRESAIFVWLMGLYN